MSQTWTVDTYAGSHAAATDLQSIEDNFATLRSSFSGTTAPGNTEAGLHWMDTSKKVMKIRNDDDSAWWGLMHGDGSQKMVVYRNAAMDGWVVDSSSATDRVVALKGGSTYTTGGANAGTWTQPDHTLVLSEIPAHSHGIAASAQLYAYGVYGTTGHSPSNEGIQSTSKGGGGAHNHGTTYRPAAAVFTLQYLNL
jgi:hypothetical protein